MADHEHHDKGWADTKAFRKGFLAVLVIAAVIAALAGLNPAWEKEQPHFEVEGWKVFFAVWGFSAFIFIVLAGQHLRKLVGRDEQYYEERE